MVPRLPLRNFVKLNGILRWVRLYTACVLFYDALLVWTVWNVLKLFSCRVFAAKWIQLRLADGRTVFRPNVCVSIIFLDCDKTTTPTEINLTPSDSFFVSRTSYCLDTASLTYVQNKRYPAKWVSSKTVAIDVPQRFCLKKQSWMTTIKVDCELFDNRNLNLIAEFISPSQ